jgi:hypothetical protein
LLCKLALTVFYNPLILYAMDQIESAQTLADRSHPQQDRNDPYQHNVIPGTLVLHPTIGSQSSLSQLECDAQTCALSCADYTGAIEPPRTVAGRNAIHLGNDPPHTGSDTARL